MLRVSLLGDFHIRQNQALVTGVDAPRLQSLLAFLMLHRDVPQSRAHLAFLFWPDTTEAQARTNLRNLLHQLRHALPAADCFLDAGVQSLTWRSGAEVILDVADFEAALGRAEKAQAADDPPAAREALEHAAVLYAGDLLPGCYEDWIVPLREKLRQAYLGALERLIRLLEEQPAAETGAWMAEWLEVQVERVWAHYWLAQWPEMAGLVDRCRPVMQACGTAAGRARFLIASVLMQLRRDRYTVSDELLAETREALKADEE